MPKRHIVPAAQLALCAVLVVLWPMTCLAQNTGLASPANQDDGAFDQRAAILKELEAMKQRITELEAQLQRTDAVASSIPLPSRAAVAGGPNEPSPLTSPMQESTPKSSSTPQAAQRIAPFSDHDWTWLNGNPRTETPAFDSKFFTPEIRVDTTYTFDFNRPADHSMGGSSEIFRSQEVQLEQLGVGGASTTTMCAPGS